MLLMVSQTFKNSVSGWRDPSLPLLSKVIFFVALMFKVSCQRDARTWWDSALPSYETNPTSRNYGWCLGNNEGRFVVGKVISLFQQIHDLVFSQKVTTW